MQQEIKIGREICVALDEIADDNSYKPHARNEARGLVTAVEKLESWIYDRVVASSAQPLC